MTGGGERERICKSSCEKKEAFQMFFFSFFSNSKKKNISLVVVVAAVANAAAPLPQLELPVRGPGRRQVR